MLYSKIGKINYKIPTILLLQSMGITKKKIIYSVKKENKENINKINPIPRETKSSMLKLNIINKKKTKFSIRKKIKNKIKKIKLLVKKF
jgi:DNA-directed RNA polymerase beta subunit